MSIRYYDSTFHVTHDEETASKMALKIDLSIFITDCLKQMKLNQTEAAARLEVTQSRISELANGKIEKFTVDAMMDMLDKLGFRTHFTMSSEGDRPHPCIVISQNAER